MVTCFNNAYQSSLLMHILVNWAKWVDSLDASGRCGQNFKIIIFKLIPWTHISCTTCKIVVRWRPQNSIDDKSTLVQVMAWSHQATSHYLSQCWPRSMSPYNVTRPQWVKPKNVSYLKFSSKWVYACADPQFLKNCSWIRGIKSVL